MSTPTTARRAQEIALEELFAVTRSTVYRAIRRAGGGAASDAAA